MILMAHKNSSRTSSIFPGKFTVKIQLSGVTTFYRRACWLVVFPQGDSVDLLGQELKFKVFGITYLVGKIKFKLFTSGSIG